jgi:hypothetical protein
MKTPQQPRGRARRGGKFGEHDHEVATQAIAAAMAKRVRGTGKGGAAPASDGPGTAAVGDRLAANRRRASRVRTGDA